MQEGYNIMKCDFLFENANIFSTSYRRFYHGFIAIRGDRAKWINDTFHPLFIEMEGAAVAQVCLRNDVAFLALKSVSDCLFGNDKYDFNFPKAMENLNAIALKFARMING